MPCECVGLVGAQDLLDQLLGAAAARAAGEVDLLCGERALDAGADELAGAQLRHGSATSSSCPGCRLRSRRRSCRWCSGACGCAATGVPGRKSCPAAGRARARSRRADGRPRAAGRMRTALRSARASQGSRRRRRARARAVRPSSVCSSCARGTAPGPPTPLQTTRMRSCGISSSSRSRSSCASPASSCASRAPNMRRTASAATSASRWTAPDGAHAARLREQGADVGDDERVCVGEGVQGGADRARLVELVDRHGPGSAGASSTGGQPVAAGDPALEQLTECRLAGCGCAQQREQRALRGSAPSRSASASLRRAGRARPAASASGAASAASELASSLAPGAPRLPSTASTVARRSRSGAPGRRCRDRGAVACVPGRRSDGGLQRMLRRAPS